MQSEGETLDLLLHTHFPDSEAVEEKVVSVFASRIIQLDWQVAAKVVNYRRVVWAIESFAPYKSPGMDGIFTALMQEGWEVLVPYLIRIFCTCLATGYVPTARRQARWCSYLSQAEILTAGLRIIDLSALHRSRLRPW
jgi:hypothetical protein